MHLLVMFTGEEIRATLGHTQQRHLRDEQRWRACQKPYEAIVEDISLIHIQLLR
jgi:hypothetical protein